MRNRAGNVKAVQPQDVIPADVLPRTNSRCPGSAAVLLAFDEMVQEAHMHQHIHDAGEKQDHE